MTPVACPECGPHPAHEGPCFEWSRRNGRMTYCRCVVASPDTDPADDDATGDTIAVTPDLSAALAAIIRDATCIRDDLKVICNKSDGTRHIACAASAVAEALTFVGHYRIYMSPSREHVWSIIPDDNGVPVYALTTDEQETK